MLENWFKLCETFNAFLQGTFFAILKRLNKLFYDDLQR